MSFKGAASSEPYKDGISSEEDAQGLPSIGETYKVSAQFTISESHDSEGNGFTANIGDTIVLGDWDLRPDEIHDFDPDRWYPKWYLIPSGDDIEDTWRVVNVNGVSIGNDVNLDINDGTTKGTIKVNNKDVKVAGVKLTQTAVADEAVDGQYVSAVAQNENGEITVSRKALSLYDATEATTAKDTTGEEEVEVPCLILCAGTASFLV
jgi:hypothetical protein